MANRQHISRPVLPRMLALFEAKLPAIRRGDDECWPFSDSAVRANAYGRVSCQRDSKFHQAVAHRVSWTYFNGPLSNEQMILHSCDYKPCVNPKHLHIGDASANNAEAHERKVNSGSSGKRWTWKSTENHWRNRAT